MLELSTTHEVNNGMTSRSRNESPEPAPVTERTDGAQPPQQDSELTITELELQLLERDELVAALTQRLEQAAEQLDRLQRTGTDRITTSSSTGIPAELLDQQQTLMEELQLTCQQWQDLQLGSSLGRVELQLNEIRDLVSGLYQGDKRIAPTAHIAVENHESDSAAKQDQVTQSDQSPHSEWEALKASLLDEDPPADSEAHSEASPVSVPEQAANQPESNEPDRAYQKLELNDPPSEIDLTQLEDQQISTGIRERDEYIAYLLHYIRDTHMANWQAPNWDHIHDVPEELCWNLQQLEKQLEDTLRLAEVELSMERARLGREAARLRQAEHDFQSKLKQAGIQLPSDYQSAATTEQNTQSKNTKRWLKFLGKKS